MKGSKKVEQRVFQNAIPLLGTSWDVESTKIHEFHTGVVLYAPATFVLYGFITEVYNIFVEIIDIYYIGTVCIDSGRCCGERYLCYVPGTRSHYMGGR